MTHAESRNFRNARDGIASVDGRDWASTRILAGADLYEPTTGFGGARRGIIGHLKLQVARVIVIVSATPRRYTRAVNPRAPTHRCRHARHLWRRFECHVN